MSSASMQVVGCIAGCRISLVAECRGVALQYVSINIIRNTKVMAKNPDLNFKFGNPGAVQYGNFINYYKFHPPEKRLRLLPPHIWNTEEPFHGLDLGCNAGDLSIALHGYLKEKVNGNCAILGVDIDPTLIQRAKEQNQNEHISFMCLDFMLDIKVLEEYLLKHNLKKFSAIFCFSLTMWIHLNNGDAGLVAFLDRICKLGELVVIEPQPWKCYKSAVKRMKTGNAEFPLFKGLKMKENVEAFIEETVMQIEGTKKIFESERGDWDRKVIIFQCNSLK